MDEAWERYGGSSGGGGGGSVFPKMGVMHGPKNNFEYDLMYAQNVDRELGITANTDAIMHTVNAGGYNSSDVERSNLVGYKWGQ